MRQSLNCELLNNKKRSHMNQIHNDMEEYARPKQNRGQTSNPEAPYPASETCDRIVWAPNPPLCLQQQALQHISVHEPSPLCTESFPSCYTMVLTSPTSQDLHWNLDLTFTASCSGLSGCACRNSKPATYFLALLAFKNLSTSLHDSVTLVSLVPAKPSSATKFYCQFKMSLDHLDHNCSGLYLLRLVGNTIQNSPSVVFSD